MPENSELSEREREILELVATGASNKEIAQKLFISTNTVKVHLRNIFAKIGVSTRTEAAMYAVQAGYVATAAQAELEPSAFQSAAVEDRAASRNQVLPILVGAALSIVVLLAGFALLNRLGVFSNSTSESFAGDTQKPEWVAIQPLPTARFGMGAAIYESRIYLIAGDLGGKVSGAVERYDPVQDSWERLASMPTPVADVQAAVVGGMIYVPGGRVASGEITNELAIYDPRLNHWSRGASLPSRLSQYALAVYEGKVYLFGGWDGADYLSGVYEYDPDQDAWQEKTPLSSARALAATVEVEGKIYLLGGFDGRKALDLNEIYSPALDDGQNDPWSSAKPLPGGGRYAAGAASLMKLVFLVGGKGAGAAETGPLGYAIEAQDWQPITPLPAGGLSFPGLVASGNHLYLFGGKTEAGEASAIASRYQVFYIKVLPFIR